MTKKYDINPDAKGYFGEYGGQILPPELTKIMQNIADEYEKIREDESFQKELADLLKNFVGRPSPVFHAKNLSKKYGAEIYLKREDLNHTGAHKINHTLGECLLARSLGYKKVLAETGAGQHGVALATAATIVGLECEIHMGEIDIEKEAPNVARMKILGAKVVPVTTGERNLKAAVDSAIAAFAANPNEIFFAIGSVVGPHPFPKMIRDFQRMVGEEAKKQFAEATGSTPDHIVACVGGGSNAIGIFSAFLEDEKVALHGVEAGGRGITRLGEHAATITLGRPGDIHGMHTILLQTNNGEIAPVHSVASGLDYPGVGPQHSFLHDSQRVKYSVADDEECIAAFTELSRAEGIIPALESSHAVAHALKLAKTEAAGKKILINLSGRGDKDIDFVLDYLSKK